MKPISWLPAAVLLGLSCLAQAQPPQYGYGLTPFGPIPHRSVPTPRQNPANEAAEVLHEGMDKLLEFLAKDENKLQVAAFLDKDMAPYFDFDYMAKWVAGPRYGQLDKKSRQALAAKLEARFLGTLAKRLAVYDGQQVRFFRPRRSGRNVVSVTVGILRPGSYPAKLDFRMYRSDDGWKVYDVVANGRSAAAYYRTQLNRKTPPPPRSFGYAR